MSKGKTIEDLRAVLFDAIDGVKSDKLSVDKAKMISELCQVMVNSAKVEVEFLKTNPGNESKFLAVDDEETEDLPAGITGRTVHKIR